MLLMTALVVLITAVYGLLFRRTTWLRLPPKRSAAALGTGLAFLVLLGSGSAFGAAHPSSVASDQPTAITASPATTKTPHATAATHTPTPTVTTKLVTETARIPFESTTVDNDTLPQGTTTVTTEGVRGVRTTTYRVTITDGKETARQQVRQEVTTPPVAQVTSVGTYVAPAPDPASVPIVDEISAKGASVEFVTEQQTYSRDTDDAIGRLMLNLLGAFAEFERTHIRERQREGIRIAKAASKYKGRNRKLTDEQIIEARRLISTGVPKTTVARGLGIDRTTLYRMLATPLSPTAPDAPIGNVPSL